MNNRWLILAAGCLIQTILGGLYAWSTFVPYLMKDFGLTSGQCGFIFGLTILTFTATMIFAGRVLSQKGPRFTVIIAASLFASGFLFASVSGGAFVILLLSLGCVTGCGIGFGYVCPLCVGMKWFPDKKGLVTGVSVAGFGAGAVLLSSIAEHYLQAGSDVLVIFRWFGVCAGLTLFTAALLLRDPPGTIYNTPKPGDMSVVFTWPFYLSSIGIFSGTFAGLLIIGNLTPIILKAGLTELQAAFAVSMFAVGNGAGRIIWGKLFDQLNYRCIPLSLGSFALLAGLLLLPIPDWMLMLSVVLVGFCFAANFVIYASAISRFFGTNAFPRLYPICFMAYGIAGAIGPGLGGVLADKTGTYHSAIYICIALVFFAGALSWLKLGVFRFQDKTEKGVA